MSPSAGSESDDEMSFHNSASMKTPTGEDSEDVRSVPPVPTMPPVLPSRLDSDISIESRPFMTKRSSHIGTDSQSPTTLMTSNAAKRASKVPPIPGVNPAS